MAGFRSCALAMFVFTLLPTMAGAQAMDPSIATAEKSDAAPPATAASSKPTLSDPSGGIEEVIVTASKRAESIRNVAGAITAFSGDKLLQNGITSIADFAGLTPGLQFNASYGTGTPVIRGVNTGSDYGQSVGIVVDGAPVGPSSSFQTGGATSLDLDPIDLQRVEVLKGPQGTIYGANSLAGLISYSLLEPDLERASVIARAGVSGTEDGSIGYSDRTAINIPVVDDRLAVRLSGFYDQRAGFIDNHLTNAGDQNHWRSDGLQASVEMQPTDRLRIFVAGIYQNQNQHAQDQLVYTADHKPRDGDLVDDDYLVPHTNRQTRFALAKIDYDLDFANLTSVTSFQHLNVDYSAPQETGTLNTIFVDVLPLLGGPLIPAPGLLSNDTLNNFKKFTQEVRLTSSGDGPLSWLVGGYYTDERSEQRQSVNARTTSGELVPLINPTLRVILPTTLREYSAFGNFTYAFSTDFDMTGGIRIGRVDQTNRTLVSGSDFAAYDEVFVLSGLGSGPPADTGPQSGSSAVTSYLATARYHYSQDGMVFARFATGYRPGGANFPVPGLEPNYKPDQTYNYEVGLKSEFWDDRGTIDLTGYYLQWKNFLAFASAGGLSGFTNAGDARVYGLESALTLRPLEGLSVTGTLAYSDSRVTSVAAGSTVARVGDSLPYNPRWSGSLAAEYSRSINTRWQLVARGEARFVGSRNSSPQSDVAFPNYVLPAYTLLDLHAGLESDRVDVDFYVKNLTDKRAQLAAFTELGINQITIEQSRTFGTTVTVKY